MILSEGYKRGYIQSFIGLVHDRGEVFEIQPMVIGNPWLDHPRNDDPTGILMWIGRNHGETLAEDIQELSKLKEVPIPTAGEWMAIMRKMPEQRVKEAFAALLSDPSKKDWGGEANDHFSANVTVGGRLRTAAFLLKGPSQFREMTPEMCGKRGDQIFRLVNSRAEVSVLQHCHRVGEAVRHTLKALAVFPGTPGKCCVIDGITTYRILKAYSLLA